MNCFCIFKDKLKCKQKAQSAPELEKQDRHGGVGTSISTSNKKSLPEHSLRVFSPQKLKKATRGCSTKIKIGGGASGSVYKGTVQLVSGKGAPIPVAVKKLNEHELQGYKDYWLAEVQFLSDVNHPNLVKLLGFCSSENDRGTDLLLVCEHMPNRSLEDHLFNQALPPLPWKTRLEIILGAAEGLAYLHKGMGVKIIYRDFKPASVLLDENFRAKLSVRGGPSYDDRL